MLPNSKNPLIYALTVNEVVVYIGQAVNGIRREREHRCKLRSGTHHNHLLQSLYNSGINLRFTVLEYCFSQFDLLAREVEYAYLFKDTVLNIGAFAVSPMQGKRHTEATIEKFREPKSLEWRNKIKFALKGKKHSAEHALHIGLSKRKPVVCETTGVLFDSVMDAAAYAGIHPVNLRKYLKSGREHHGKLYRYVT